MAESRPLMSSSEELEACVKAWDLTFGFAPSMVAKAACELRIPDILAEEGKPLSSLQIAERLGSQQAPHHAAEQLDRMMRFLCANGVFGVHVDANASEPAKYCLTPVSKCLIQTGVSSLLLFQTSPAMLAPWHHLSERIMQRALPFDKANGMDLWAFANGHPELGHLLNAAMACSSPMSLEALLRHYHGFGDVHTLVDVGGGIGAAASRIVARYPSIKAINYDQPHVVATAPIHPGVEHVGGDMFQSIPSGDAIFMKWVLHDWDDDDCIKILKNCHKALPKSGKVIIMDAVLDTTNSREHPFNNYRMAVDMVLMAHTTGGKERTKEQWEVILQGAGFPRYTIIELPCPQCVIEAFLTLDTS